MKSGRLSTSKGGSGERGSRRVALFSACLSVVLVVLLFQARAPAQTLPGRVIRSVTTGEDPSRITAEQKKRVREKKLDEYKAQRKAQCDDQGKWTSFPVRDGCGDGNVCGTYDYADRGRKRHCPANLRSRG